MLRYTTDRVRPGLVAFYDLARKWSTSILTTPEPAWGLQNKILISNDRVVIDPWNTGKMID